MTARIRTVLLTACSALVPLAASAQTTTAPPGALRVETVESGFVVAPDARFTEINGDFATLAGAYGGWLTDRTLLVGAGAYWLANRADDFKMQYAGGLARWTVGGHRRLGVSAGALIGLGDATLSRSYGDLFGNRIDRELMSPRNARFDNHGHWLPPVTGATRVAIDESFFIAEPQVSGVWNMTGWMRLDAGVGYRLIGGADLLGDQLRGVSGSIAVQFGR
jgi:hypothetical protein